MNEFSFGLRRTPLCRLLAPVLLVVGAGALHAQSPFPFDTLARRSRTFDVLHYGIVVNFQEEQKKVLGKASITFTPLVERLDSIALDAVSMDVHSVTFPDGRPLRFDNRSPQLVIHLPAPRSLGDTLTVFVDYSCSPRLGLYFIQADSTEPDTHNQIWTQGEDMDNRYWFPCYDYPNDKATSEVTATVRDNYVLVSNGALVEMTQDKKNRTRTYHWRESKPHSSYLIMLAAGEYDVLQDRYGSIPLLYYVYKGQTDDARRTFAKTPEILKFFGQKIGYPYPWEKCAQIIIDDFMWGGMENTSAITYNAVTILDRRAELDFSSDEVIAHELAHQWWGDVVTLRDWTHMWLNEGFADYFESLFKEHDKGRDEFQYEMMREARNVVHAEQAYGRRPLVSHNSLTANLYSKGGWVLHMLRCMLGENVFWRAMNYYIHRFEYRVVDTHEFQLAVEDATGQNLRWFFDQWVFKSGYPALSVTKVWDGKSKSLALTIKQTQPPDSLCGVFTFPVDIQCTTHSGKSTTTEWVSKADQTLSISLDEEPLMVIVDKGQKVLKSIDFEKPEPELVYQLEHAEDVNDRVDAARELRKFKESDTVFGALSESARNDRFWGVRREATISLGVMTQGSVKDTLFRVYRDSNSRVRDAAVVALERFKDRDVVQFLEAAAASESSYVVLGSCVRTLAEIDSTIGFEYARRYVDMNSYRDIVRRAALGVMYELRDRRSLPFGLRYARPGHSSSIRVTAVNIIGELGGQDSVARSMMIRMINDKNAGVRSAVIRGLGGWGGDGAKLALEGRKAIEEDPEVLKVIDQTLARMEDGTGAQSAH